MHVRAPTPQALRPLSYTREENRDNQDQFDEINTTAMNNQAINLENKKQRPSTSKTIISNNAIKRYQTTRLIINGTGSNLPLQKPPKPRNSGKGMAMTKL